MQAQFGALIGKHQFFQADLATLAFFHTHQAGHIQIQRHKHFSCHADLAFTAIDQHQVGEPRFAQAHSFCELAVATCQHLSHSGVIIATRDALDVVTAVFAGLHFVVVKHHAGGLGGFPCGVRNIETFHPETVQVIYGHVQDVDQGAGTRLLRTFLGQQAGKL